MDSNLTAIITRSATLIIFGLYTFALGLKSCRNKTDTEKVRDIYKEMFNQFDDLKTSLVENKARRWANYEQYETGLYEYQYYTPMQKLQTNGDLLHINQSVAEKAMDLETDVLDYGQIVFEHINIVHNILVSDRSLYKESGKFTTFGSPNLRNNFETINPNKTLVSKQFDYRNFFEQGYIKNLFHSSFEAERPFALEFRSNLQGRTLSFKIFPDSLTLPIDEFLKRIYEQFELEIKDFSSLRLTKYSYINQIDKLNKKIRKRVRSPFFFWETLIGAIGDLFTF